MRARRTPRVPTAAKLAVGATVLAFPATAMAVTGSGTNAQATPAGTLHAAHPKAVTYGHPTIVRGSAPVSAAGSPVALEYRPALADRWRTLAHSHVLPNGRFALSAHVTRSGSLKVIAAKSSTHPSELTSSDSANATARPAAVPLADHGQLQASRVQHLTVKPKLALNRRSASAVVGQPALIRGHLLPGVAGRKLVLDVRRDGRWIPAGTARTKRGGAFKIRYVPGASATEKLHVAFAGDKLNSRAKSAPETVSPMEYAEVSWYEDAGDTACGFHATYGIASRTLPCGSKVTLSYGGRSVVATVDDRGPFVYSRLYDLNQNVAGKLGMYGVATVLASA